MYGLGHYDGIQEELKNLKILNEQLMPLHGKTVFDINHFIICTYKSP